MSKSNKFISVNEEVKNLISGQCPIFIMKVYIILLFLLFFVKVIKVIHEDIIL